MNLVLSLFHRYLLHMTIYFYLLCISHVMCFIDRDFKKSAFPLERTKSNKNINERWEAFPTRVTARGPGHISPRHLRYYGLCGNSLKPHGTFPRYGYRGRVQLDRVRVCPCARVGEGGSTNRYFTHY